MSEHPHLPGTRWDARVFDDDGSRHEPDAAELLEQAHEIMARARRDGALAGRNSPQDGPGSTPTSEGTPEVGGDAVSPLPDPQEGSDPMGRRNVGSPQGTPPVDADGFVIGPYGSAGRTHCIHGHPFTPENTYWDRSQTPATRKCRTCRRENKRKARHQRRGW